MLWSHSNINITVQNVFISSWALCNRRWKRSSAEKPPCHSQCYSPTCSGTKEQLYLHHSALVSLFSSGSFNTFCDGFSCLSLWLLFIFFLLRLIHATCYSQLCPSQEVTVVLLFIPSSSSSADTSRVLWPSRCRTCSCPRPGSAPVGLPPPALPSAFTVTCRRSWEAAPPPSKMPTSLGRRTDCAKPRWVCRGRWDHPVSLELLLWPPFVLFLIYCPRTRRSLKIRRYRCVSQHVCVFFFT